MIDKDSDCIVAPATIGQMKDWIVHMEIVKELKIRKKKFKEKKLYTKKRKVNQFQMLKVFNTWK